jgi:hypothetical protein
MTVPRISAVSYIETVFPGCAEIQFAATKFKRSFLGQILIY